MPRDPRVFLVFAAIVLVGGGNFVAVRFSNRELAPFWGAGLRFALAAMLLLALTRLAGWPLPRGRALVGAMLYGALGFGASYAFMYWGLLEAPAALAAVTTALVPLETLFLASALGLERLRVAGLGGAAVALAGTAIVFGDQLRAVSFGSLGALIAGSFCVAAATVAAKRFPRVHPVPMNGVAMLPGVALLVVLSIVAGEVRLLPTRPEVVVAFAYLVLVGSTVLFIGFLYVLQRWTASATSYATLLFPLVTAAIGAVLAGEAVSPQFVAGAALIVVGVYLGALAPSRPGGAAPVPA